MTYEVTIKADNGPDLEALLKAFGRGLEPLPVQTMAPIAIHIPEGTAPTGSIQESLSQVLPVREQPEVTITTTAEAAAPEAPKQKRTRKVTQAPDPVAQAVSVTDSQAQVDNSASEVSGTPPEMKSPEEAAGDTTGTPMSAPAASVVTFDDMKAKLQAVAAKIGGDEGLAHVSEIIGKFGARKIKEVPEDKFAEAVALCEKALS
ncbi:hypothetical protein [Nitrosovibrio sp. Nv4]|uniref:hypothetical protein n=1 Tax=Nitrosovibrio sp. Nv4 TaxID=1945880 RepID=UPI000BD28E01|nr:hypothetical protein [Nitrosovibrio sp. Nv4]SOD41349.1 hypothetical protein SAMN06298226_1644 [Nitrosovibrio sp. Nv4]